MLILFDLDDTLLDKEKKVSEFTIQTLQHFQKKGHILSINSARPYLFSKTYSDLIGCDYNICNGGTEIYRGDELIYTKLIEKDLVNDFIESCKDYYRNITVQGKMAYSPDKQYSAFNQFAEYFDFKTPFFEDSSKIVVDSINDEAIEAYCKSKGLIFCKYLGQSWARVSPSDKGEGMLALMSLINEKESIAFGDDTGDLEMLEAASYGVCMANSRKNVLERISLVTEYDCNHDGVARHLLQMEEKGIL